MTTNRQMIVRIDALLIDHLVYVHCYVDCCCVVRDTDRLVVRVAVAVKHIFLLVAGVYDHTQSGTFRCFGGCGGGHAMVISLIFT